MSDLPYDGVRTAADCEVYLPTAPRSAPEFALAAERLEQADPVADAFGAIEAGDKRLWAGATKGEFIPGAPESTYESYRRQYGLRFFFAGCVIHSDEEERFRLSAVAYAERYNQTVLASVGR